MYVLIALNVNIIINHYYYYYYWIDCHYLSYESFASQVSEIIQIRVFFHTCCMGNSCDEMS